MVNQSEQWHQFINGSRGAFKQLYEQYAEMMYRYGLHLTGNRELLEDVIHDLFVYLYEKRSSLPRHPESISAYLLVSFRRRLFRRIKEEALTFCLETLPEDGTVADRSAESDLLERENREEREQLIAYIHSQLTDRQKQLIYLRFREQLSFRDIATIMEISEQSAKNQMQKTLLKLRGRLRNTSIAPQERTIREMQLKMLTGMYMLPYRP